MNPIFSQMSEENTMCVFHAADLDGWMSCAVAMQAGIAAEDFSNVYWYSYDKIDADDLARRMKESGRSSFDYVLTGDIGIPEETVFALDLYGIRTVTTDHHATTIRKYACRKAEGWKSLYVSSAEQDENYAAASEVFWIGRNDAVTEPEKRHCHNTCFFPKPDEIISGALLLWLAVNGGRQEIPDVLELVSAWDAWDLNSRWRSDSILFNCACTSRMNRMSLKMGKDAGRNEMVKTVLLPLLYSTIDAFSATEELMKEGELLQAHNEGEWARTARNAYTINWEGCRLLCLNARGPSLVARTAYDPDQHEGIVMWSINREGKVSVSLFNEHVTSSSPDFSEIAKKHGGGGHKGAAGCVMSKIPPEFLIPVE